MRTLDPQIQRYFYPSGNPYWRVTCTLANGRHYQKKYPHEEDAEVDRIRLIREHSGGSIGREELKLAELAISRLQTSSNPDANGKSILEAADYFIENFREKRSELTVSEYIDDFVERKRKRRAWKTVREIQYYLNQFESVFGTRKPSSISWKEINRYIQVNNSIFHRYKVLRGFFAWLANEGRDISKLEHPPLTSNPLHHIERPKQSGRRPKICTTSEVKKLIEAAIKERCLPYVVFGFFTGMRPESELNPFLRDPQLGWNLIDFEEKKILVSDELEKTGKRTREITIQKNFLEWLDFFERHSDLFPLYSTNLMPKFRRIRNTALPDEKRKEPDIMRHTFISNFSRIETIQEVCFQCATSMSMIRKHYRVLISEKKRAEDFFNIRPGSFGLI